MKRTFRVITVLVFCLMIYCGLLWAQDVSFEASVDRNKTAVDTAIELTLTVQGTQKVPAFDLPAIEGFESKYLGPSTSISIINGQVSSSISHKYLLFPQKAGTFRIPAFEMEFGSKIYTSKPIDVEIVASRDNIASQDQQSSMPPLAIEDKVFLVLETKEQNAFVNEKVHATLRLFVAQVPLADINFPILSQEGFWMEDIPQPRQYQQTVDGINYQVIEFSLTFYPTRIGSLTVGPAELNSSVLYQREQSRDSFFRGFGRFSDDFFGDFFGRHEKHPLTLRSNEVKLNVRVMPEPMPKDFSLAVGRFDFSVTADPLEIKVGDPITLRLTVSGEGHLRGIQLPRLNENDDFRVFDPKTKEEAGVRIREQVLIPKHKQVTRIPELSFTFFDPEKEAYQTITRGPFNITVKESETSGPLQVIERSSFDLGISENVELGRDIIFIKDHPGTFYRLTKISRIHFVLWVFIVFYTIVILLSILFYQRKQRLATDLAYARRVKAPEKAKKGLKEAGQFLAQNKSKEFYESVFRLLQGYLTHKFLIPEGNMTAQGVEGFLKDQKISNAVLNQIKIIFSDCETIRYGALQADLFKMKHTFSLLKEIIDQLERI